MLLAVTLKAAWSPLVTMRFCGCAVMVGGCNRFSTAGGLLVMTLHALVTTTVNCAPPSASTTGDVT